MNWITQHAMGWLIAALPIGAMTFALAQYIKKASDWIDTRPPALKRTVLIPAIAAVLTALGAAMNIPIVCEPDTNCLTQLNGDTLNAAVKAALGVVVAWVVHAGKNGNAKR